MKIEKADGAVAAGGKGGDVILVAGAERWHPNGAPLDGDIVFELPDGTERIRMTPAGEIIVGQLLVRRDRHMYDALAQWFGNVLEQRPEPGKSLRLRGGMGWANGKPSVVLGGDIVLRLRDHTEALRLEPVGAARERARGPRISHHQVCRALARWLADATDYEEGLEAPPTAPEPKAT